MINTLQDHKPHTNTHHTTTDTQAVKLHYNKIQRSWVVDCNQYTVTNTKMWTFPHVQIPIYSCLVAGKYVICNNVKLNLVIFYCSCKGKAVSLQAWSGPEGSRKLRFPDFMTTAQDGGKVVNFTHRPPLPTANAPGTHFC